MYIERYGIFEDKKKKLKVINTGFEPIFFNQYAIQTNYHIGTNSKFVSFKV